MRPGRHVLVVDDDSIQRRLVQAHLLSAGCSVSTASGASEALEAAHARTPDVILSDVVMGELNGFALCSVLRCDVQLANVPIILVTAHCSGERDQKLAFAMGARMLLQRTPDFQAELAAVSSVLDAQPATGPSEPWRPAPGVQCMASQLARLLTLSQAATDRTRMLLENGSNVGWTALPDGQRLVVTPNIQNLCGFTSGELMQGDRYNEQIHPDDRPRVEQSFLALAMTGGRLDMEYRLRHRDGRWVWLHDRGASSVIAGGTVVVNGVSTDISDRKKLEEEVRVSQKMEAVGQLTAGIAHDFNNTLAIILGNAELLRDAIPEADDRRADLDQILEASHSATALTRQLLTFSRRDVVEPRVIDLNQSVVGVERLLRRVIGEDIAFSIELADGFATVCADPGEIEQVIMNLVVNARDAMPHGGALAISTSNASVDDVQGERLGIASGSYVALTVSDTGCGIESSIAGKLFDPFFTTKDPGKGTGLGLATCGRIVKQAGGAFAVESEPGRGSRFTVYLPTVAAAGQAAGEAETLEPAAGGQETVLLIEDDDQVRNAIHRRLGKSGYQVVAAHNGDEAVVLATLLGHVDLVMADAVGPVSGPDIVRRIERQCGPTKALFMSAYAVHAVLEDEQLNAAHNFISKPFTAAALARKVRDVLDRGDAPEAARRADMGGSAPDRVTVLLAEDDPLLREFLRDLLLAEGYGVIDTSSAEEAAYVGVPEAQDVGLVVADIQMPGADGVTLVENLRSHHPDLPVLFISGSTVPRRLSPRDSFLKKPFRASVFIDAVSALLAGVPPVATEGASQPETRPGRTWRRARGADRRGIPASTARTVLIGDVTR